MRSRYLLMPEQFRTDRLLASRLRREDAEEIFYTYASKPEATKYVSWPTHKSLQDTRDFLSYAAAGWAAGIDYSYGLRLNGRLVGSIGVVNNNGSIQFGYILSPSQWGKGLATEACRKLMEILSSLDGVNSVGTFVDVENAASARVLVKSGLNEIERRARWFRFVNQQNEEKDCLLFRLPLPRRPI